MADQRTSITYNTIVLYAAEDLRYIEHIERHINRRNDSKRLGKLLYKPLEALTGHYFSSDSSINNYLAVICLLSNDFIFSEFGFSRQLKNLRKHHNLKRTPMIPVLLEACELSSTPFNNIAGFSSNAVPIKQLPKEEYHPTLAKLASEICERLQKQMVWKETLERHWQDAQKADTIADYQFFLDQYPNSQYAGKADARRKALVEEKLWKEAVSFDNVSFYFQYLTESPFQKYRKEALDKIIEIENDEPLARTEMMKEHHLGILLDYKLKFRKNGDINAVNQRIFETMTTPSTDWLDKAIPENSESNFLELQVFRQCNSNELMTYGLLERFQRGLAVNMASLEEKIKERKWYYLPIIFLLSLTFFLLLLRYWLGPLVFDKWLAIKLFFIYLFVEWIKLAVNAIRSMFEESRLIREKAEELRRVVTELKISFLTNDPVGRDKSILYLFNAEEWVAEVDSKTLLNYLFPPKEKENSRAEDLSAIHRVKYFQRQP